MKSDEDPNKPLLTEDRGMIGYLAGTVSERLDRHCWEQAFSIGFFEDHPLAVKEGLRRCFQNDFEVTIVEGAQIDHDTKWRLTLSLKV